MPYVIIDRTRPRGYAVADLQAARIEVEGTILSADGFTDDAYPLARQACELPESGGSIELPDGTTIDVRPVENWQLGSMAGRVWHEDDDPMPDERYPHELRDY